jgi:hypothetical protein
MLEIVISLVAAVARKFMQGRLRGLVPLIKATNDFWLVRNDPDVP